MAHADLKRALSCRPARPPHISRTLLRRKIKSIKRAPNRRPIGGAQTCLWPLTRIYQLFQSRPGPHIVTSNGTAPDMFFVGENKLLLQTFSIGQAPARSEQFRNDAAGSLTPTLHPPPKDRAGPL